jgi:hypothetical protein
MWWVSDAGGTALIDPSDELSGAKLPEARDEEVVLQPESSRGEESQPHRGQPIAGTYW